MQPSDMHRKYPPVKLSPSDAAKKAWSKRAPVVVECQRCGKTRLTRMPQTTKWCSNECNWRASCERGVYDERVRCKICRQEFVSRPNTGKRHRLTCSARCRSEAVSQKNAKLQPEAVRAIREYGDEGKTQRWIAKAFKVSQNAVQGILCGRTFKWMPETPAKEHDAAKRVRATAAEAGGGACTIPAPSQAPMASLDSNKAALNSVR